MVVVSKTAQPRVLLASTNKKELVASSHVSPAATIWSRLHVPDLCLGRTVLADHSNPHSCPPPPRRQPRRRPLSESKAPAAVPVGESSPVLVVGQTR
jgi:hypothetical protein